MLSSIEKKVFKDEKAMNEVMSEYIVRDRMFDFLELASERFLYRDVLESEIDFCLNLYNKFIRKGEGEYLSKLYAMRETFNYIGSKEPDPTLRELRNRK